MDRVLGPELVIMWIGIGDDIRIQWVSGVKNTGKILRHCSSLSITTLVDPRTVTPYFGFCIRVNRGIEILYRFSTDSVVDRPFVKGPP